MMQRMIKVLTFSLLMLIAMPLLAHEEFRIIGVVTRRTAANMRVKTKEGKTITIGLSKDTFVFRDKKQVAATELKAGNTVVVDALGDTEDDSDAVAVMIVPAIAPQPKK